MGWFYYQGIIKIQNISIAQRPMYFINYAKNGASSLGMNINSPAGMTETFNELASWFVTSLNQRSFETLHGTSIRSMCIRRGLI